MRTSEVESLVSSQMSRVTKRPRQESWLNQFSVQRGEQGR